MRRKQPKHLAVSDLHIGPLTPLRGLPRDGFSIGNTAGKDILGFIGDALEEDTSTVIDANVPLVTCSDSFEANVPPAYHTVRFE